MAEATGVVTRARAWRGGSEVARDFPLDDLDTWLAEPDTVVWFDVVRPDTATLKHLAHELALDPHSLEDAVAASERPKSRRHAKYTFVQTYAAWLGTDPGPERSRMVLSRVSAFVLKGALVTIRLDDRWDMSEALARWDEDRDLLDHGPKVLIHGLLDLIVDGHFDVVQQLDSEVEDIEDDLFAAKLDLPRVQGRVYQLRKELTELRRVVLPMREVVGTLEKRGDATTTIDPDLVGRLDDLYDHALRAAEWTESLRDMISSIFETSLSLADAHLNTVMKKLAGWAAIIAVPTAITGWFGQNVPYPGFSSHFGLVQSIVLIVACSVGLYILFRVKDWI